MLRIRPRELKELFTVWSFFKIDAAIFHFSFFIISIFRLWNKSSSLLKENILCRGQTFPHLDLAYQQSHIYSLWIGLLMIFHLHQWFKAKTWIFSWFLICFCNKLIRHESTSWIHGVSNIQNVSRIASTK